MEEPARRREHDLVGTLRSDAFAHRAHAGNDPRPPRHDRVQLPARSARGDWKHSNSTSLSSRPAADHEVRVADALQLGGDDGRQTARALGREVLDP